MVKVFVVFLLLCSFTQADVVKPALVEISIFDNKKIEVVIDLSLEAAMTGIGTQYKRTIDAPNSAQYDTLRSLVADDLRVQFKAFGAEFLSRILLTINGTPQHLTLTSAKIDIVGYKQRPRKTLLTYSTQLGKWPKTLSWQYNKAYGDSAFRYQVYKEGEYNWSEWRWLRNGISSGVIDINHPEPMTTVQRFLQFVSIGFEHVIPLGWDHILFIIGMALSSLMWRRLLLLVSTFTLAHTLTLGLAMFGVVEISGRIIEPLIAFSIAYVAIENLLPNQSIKRKSIVVFLFGLVHGLGFASMLKSFKISSDNFLTILISFNIGVELAQVVIVSGVVSLLFFIKSLNLNYKKIAIIPSSIVIALIGIWWGVERMTG